MKNWKTSLFALLAVLPQILKLYPELISPVMVDTISIIMGAVGISYAKDHNVTGGTTANEPNNKKVVKSTIIKDSE